jgi:hypothetical protein
VNDRAIAPPGMPQADAVAMLVMGGIGTRRRLGMLGGRARPR